MVNTCQAMPGMTPDRIWALPQVEWWIVAEFTDRWANEQRDQQRARR